MAVKGWYAQREHSTFIAPDQAEIYLIDTIYMWHASREIKENGEPAIQVFLRSFPAIAFGAETRAMSAGTKMQCVQAQHNGKRSPDVAEINYLSTTYLQLVLFLKKREW